MREALAEQPWDVIISDYQMPRFNGPTALTVLQEHDLDIPFIVVSGTVGEDVAVTMMTAGSQDYLMKGVLTRLVPAVERELLEEIGRAHVWTPVTNAHHVCRILLEKKKTKQNNTNKNFSNQIKNNKFKHDNENYKYVT